jgi:hypothetical protein
MVRDEDIGGRKKEVIALSGGSSCIFEVVLTYRLLRLVAMSI